MQTKEIPVEPILKHLDWLTNPHDICGQWADFGNADGRTCKKGHWTLWYSRDKPYSLYKAFPPDCPEKVALAKMRSLEKQGLIQGCTCGCRGDFEITVQGKKHLEEIKEVE